MGSVGLDAAGGTASDLGLTAALSGGAAHPDCLAQPRSLKSQPQEAMERAVRLPRRRFGLAAPRWTLPTNLQPRAASPTSKARWAWMAGRGQCGLRARTGSRVPQQPLSSAPARRWALFSGPEGSPEQAGGPLERWAAARAAVGEGRVGYAAVPEVDEAERVLGVQGEEGVRDGGGLDRALLGGGRGAAELQADGLEEGRGRAKVVLSAALGDGHATLERDDLPPCGASMAAKGIVGGEWGPAMSPRRGDPDA